MINKNKMENQKATEEFTLSDIMGWVNIIA